MIQSNPMENPLMGHLNNELDMLRLSLASYYDSLQKTYESRLSEAKNNKDHDALNEAHTRLGDRLAQIQNLIEVPAFQRIEFSWEGDTDSKVIWIAKFGYLPAFIYSWATPLGKLRFQNCGKFSLTTPGGTKHGTIHGKQIFQLANRRIIFLSIVTPDGTDLIHQEHFANHEFALKEVVSRLESYQDEIISTNYQTPLQITGPAGSGKTTLGFHRLAYLHQNSSNTDIFDTTSSLALINDESTRDYFISVLRPLNIGHQVQVATPTEWMQGILRLPKNIMVENGYTSNDKDTLWYYYEKAHCQLPDSARGTKQPIEYLTMVYSTLPSQLQSKWRNQSKAKILDRYDLAILLREHYRYNGCIMYHKPVQIYTKRFGGIIQEFPEKLHYASILMDEFQNYTRSENIMIQSCIHGETNTLMFVGDPNQKTLPGTQVVIPEVTKKIHIDKSYRNSKAILRYLRSNGYSVPHESGSLAKGEVIEYRAQPATLHDQIESIAEQILSNHPGESLGIVVTNEKSSNELKQKYKNANNLVIGTPFGVQGVEFEHAIVVIENYKEKTNEKTSKADAKYPKEFQDEYEAILRDRNYVALTRAINILHVVNVDAVIQ